MQPIERHASQLEKRLWHHLDYYQSTARYLRRLENRFSEAETAQEIEALSEEIGATRQELEHVNKTIKYLEDKISKELGPTQQANG